MAWPWARRCLGLHWPGSPEADPRRNAALCADLTDTLSLAGSEPCSAPGQSDQNGSATHDQKEVARRSGTL